MSRDDTLTCEQALRGALVARREKEAGIGAHNLERAPICRPMQENADSGIREIFLVESGIL